MPGRNELRAGCYAVTPRVRARVKVLRLYMDNREIPPRRVAIVRFLASGMILHVWPDDLEVVR